MFDLYENDPSIFEKTKYGLQWIDILEKYGSLEEKKEAYLRLAKIYHQEGLFKKATELYSIAIINAANSQAFEAKIGLLQSLRNDGQLTEAAVLANFYLEEPGYLNSEIIQFRIEEAKIHYASGNHQLEIKAYEQLITLLQNTKDASIRPVIWNNIGFAYKKLGKNIDAKKSFYKAIDFSFGKNADPLGIAFQNLGLLFYNEQSLDSSLILLQNAQKVFEKTGNHEFLVQSINFEALNFYRKNDHYNALKRIQVAIEKAKTYRLPKELSKAYEIKSMIHQDLFEYELALDFYQTHLSIRDSLLLEERAQENTNAFNLFKLEQIEKELRIIWAQTEIENQNLARERAEKEAEKERLMPKPKPINLESLSSKIES